MARERYIVDMDHLMVALYSQHFGDRMEVAAESDVDAVERLPLLIVNSGQGTSVDSGPHGVAVNWNVSVTILAGSRGEGSDLADEVTEITHGFASSWNPGVGMIPGIGAIVAVDDISLPSKSVSAEIPAGNLHQFDGVFSIISRKA